LAEHGYPPVPQDEVFKEIFEQAENFKKYEQADENDTGKTAPVISMYPQFEEEEGMMMAAEDIFIYGSIPVDLPNIKRDQLTNGKLDLVLMYAIGSSARHKTETAGKIALGIKEGMLKDEQMAAYKSVKYLMFHYWSNPKAYQLTKEPLLVNKDEVPSEYLIRMEKSAVKYLLLDYNPQQSADLGNVNIMKTQRRGEIRYLPFVTTLESIVDE
jgi:type I restriction enzyme R subunit